MDDIAIDQWTGTCTCFTDNINGSYIFGHDERLTSKSTTLPFRIRIFRRTTVRQPLYMSVSSKMVKPSSLGSGSIVGVVVGGGVVVVVAEAARPKNMRRNHDEEDPSAANDDPNETFDSIITSSSNKRWTCFVLCAMKQSIVSDTLIKR